jgi:hypothetical protein
MRRGFQLFGGIGRRHSYPLLAKPIAPAFAFITLRAHEIWGKPVTRNCPRRNSLLSGSSAARLKQKFVPVARRLFCLRNGLPGDETQPRGSAGNAAQRRAHSPGNARGSLALLPSFSPRINSRSNLRHVFGGPTPEKEKMGETKASPRVCGIDKE